MTRPTHHHEQPGITITLANGDTRWFQTPRLNITLHEDGTTTTKPDDSPSTIELTPNQETT